MRTTMKFRTAYGPKLKLNSNTTGPSRTKQSMKDECDVNLILARHSRTGILSHLNQMEARYGDLVGIDFQTAANIVADARSLFEELPAKIRKKFGNNPGQFLEFTDDPANRDKLVEMGLATKREVQSMQTQPSQTPLDKEPATDEET